MNWSSKWIECCVLIHCIQTSPLLGWPVLHTETALQFSVYINLVFWTAKYMFNPFPVIPTSLVQTTKQIFVTLFFFQVQPSRWENSLTYQHSWTSAYTRCSQRDTLKLLLLTRERSLPISSHSDLIWLFMFLSPPGPFIDLRPEDLSLQVCMRSQSWYLFSDVDFDGMESSSGCWEKAGNMHSC